MTIQDVEMRILAEFAKNKIGLNEILKLQSLFVFISRLNPKEKDLFPSAIESLIKDSCIEEFKSESIEGYKLLQSGFDRVYPSQPESISSVKEKILKGFINNQSNVGQYLDERWYINQFSPTLSPNEKLVVVQAFESLESDGLIEIILENNKISKIILTQAGFDYIYP
jgi:hypothetical protein